MVGAQDQGRERNLSEVRLQVVQRVAQLRSCEQSRGVIELDGIVEAGHGAWAVCDEFCSVKMSRIDWREVCRAYGT